MTFVYLDTETMGLTAGVHDIFEVAYALDDGPILSSFLHHSPIPFEQAAKDINHYDERMAEGFDGLEAIKAEAQLFEDLHGATIVGANPGFDIRMLTARWGGEQPWHHRPLCVEVYGMGALGYDQPQSLARMTHSLWRRGYEIPEPDHTAAGDVATTRAVHHALKDMYDQLRGNTE